MADLMLKSPARFACTPPFPPRGFTVRETGTVWVKSSDDTVLVAVEGPVVVVEIPVKLTVLDPVVLAGLKDEVTPLGRPDAGKLTLPLKPFSGFTVIVLLPLAPCVTLRLLGDAES